MICGAFSGDRSAPAESVGVEAGRTALNTPGPRTPKAVTSTTVCALGTGVSKYGTRAYSPPVAVCGTQMPLSTNPVVITWPTARFAIAEMPVHGGSPAANAMTSVLSVNPDPVATTYVLPRPTTVTVPLAFTVTMAGF